MRKILVLILLCPLISFASELSNSNKLFDFAETAFPEFFEPAGSETFELNGYLVRYYADSDTYIGTQSSDVYVYGDVFKGLLQLGKISDYIELELEGDALFAELFATQQSDVQLEGQGVVVALLSDDLQGDRHQRFIVKLDSGQTLLLAHNIDLAPRLNALSVGDWVEFFGEYEWNDKGGVMHWTHYDPAGRHIDGWILHNGVMYQKL